MLVELETGARSEFLQSHTHMEKSEVQSGSRLIEPWKRKREEWGCRAENREGERNNPEEEGSRLFSAEAKHTHQRRLPLRAGIPVEQASLEHLFQTEDVLSYNQLHLHFPVLGDEDCGPGRCGNSEGNRAHSFHRNSFYMSITCHSPHNRSPSLSEDALQSRASSSHWECSLLYNQTLPGPAHCNVLCPRILTSSRELGTTCGYSSQGAEPFNSE